MPLAVDSSLEEIIRPYRVPLEQKMAETIVRSDGPLTLGLPESPLSNMICDLLLYNIPMSSGKYADVCFLNFGGLRIELPEGPVSRSMIFEMMPFENEVVIVQLDGLQLQQLLNQVAARGGGPIGGVTMLIRGELADSVFVQGEALSASSIYNVLTSDYLLAGGDKYTIPAPKLVERPGTKIRDALIDIMLSYQEQGKNLSPRTDGRIRKLVTP